LAEYQLLAADDEQIGNCTAGHTAGRIDQERIVGARRGCFACSEDVVDIGKRLEAGGGRVLVASDRTCREAQWRTEHPLLTGNDRDQPCRFQGRTGEAASSGSSRNG